MATTITPPMVATPDERLMPTLQNGDHLTLIGGDKERVAQVVDQGLTHPEYTAFRASLTLRAGVP